MTARALNNPVAPGTPRSKTGGAVVAAVLTPASVFYGAVIRTRNACYDRQLLKTRYVDVPVVAVGNITTGGTGKTPMVIALARTLDQLGYKPGVILRGYGGTAEVKSDEEQLLRRELPGMPVVADPDRVAAAEKAVEQSADVLVADDAYQHRRLGRDLNVCLIDATCPFGYDKLLPAGRLREPLNALARADIVVLTRYRQRKQPWLEQIKSTIHDYAPGVPILPAAHTPTRIVDLQGRANELDALVDTSVIAFAGIGQPNAFFDSLIRLGTELADTVSFPDHHRFTLDDLEMLAEKREQSHAEILVCTAKDAIKLDADLVTQSGLDPADIQALEIEIELSDDDRAVLHDRLNAMMANVNRSALEAACNSE